MFLINFDKIESSNFQTKIRTFKMHNLIDYLQNFETFGTVWRAVHTICHDKTPSNSGCQVSFQSCFD